MDKPILEMKKINKRFPGVHALKDMSLELKKGEVHALLGENGAGKSTLIKLLGGIYDIDEGDIYISGEKQLINNVRDSQNLGISIIHQEISLVPHMSVADNIFLGREVPSKGPFYNKDQTIIQAQKIIDSMELGINANSIVDDLSLAKQQMIEIAKAVSVDAKIIIMDEPTASLTNKEVDMLFETIRDLVKREISIIYISHKLDELFAICDRITIMRDGEYIKTVVTKDVTHDVLVSLMVGRELTDLYNISEHEIGEEILKVENLNSGKTLKDINFSLKKGEILGFSGLVGSGRTELMRAIFGIDPFDSGEISVEGQKIIANSPSKSMEYGLSLVPENRKEQGLILIKDVGYNITLNVLKQFMSFVFTDHNIENEIIDEYINRLNIKTPSKEQIVINLSGGNQQKIVIAKWLATKPKILILDEPTRGVDIGAKSEIYAIISELAKAGISIIMVSSELPEIINMSDRIIVMCQGEIAGELEKDEFSQELIMGYATGTKLKEEVI